VKCSYPGEVSRIAPVFEEPSQPPSSHKTNNPRLIALLLIVGFLLSLGVSILLSDTEETPDTDGLVVPRGNLSDTEKTTIKLFKKASPSVVHVVDTVVPAGRLNLNILEMARGTGSGFLWDQQGHVVTNYHVIEAALKAQSRTVYVIFENDNVTEATIVGTDPDKDLAVLKAANPPSLQPILRGTSHDLEVGQSVLAIGNPFGLDHTLTTGIISGLGREIESVSRRPIRGVIQTDAAINPGNSGGPLLDSSGRLIGINTAIASPTGAYAGIGFAVPIDTINRIVPQLIEKGYAEHPGLGVHILPPNQARGAVSNGVVIHEVVKNSPAARAGLLGTHWDGRRLILGDVIVGLGGRNIRSSADLFDVLDSHAIGDTLSFEVIRNSRPKKRLKGEIQLQSLR